MRVQILKLTAGALIALFSCFESSRASAEESNDNSSRIEALSAQAARDEARGDFRAAAVALSQAQSLAEASGDKARLTAIVGALGNARIATGPPGQAQKELEEAIDLAHESTTPGVAAAALNNLGNLLVFEDDNKHALERYTEAAREAAAAGDALLVVQAKANAARAALQLGQYARAEELLRKALLDANALPASRKKAFLLVHLGRTAFQLGKAAPDPSKTGFLQAHETLSAAASLAAGQGDERTSSYALGYLGELYEQQGRTKEALDLTRRAVFAAQAAKVPESLYLWEWQTGRLLRTQGKTAEAIDSYGHAVRELEGLRYQLASSYGGASTSFRESVGPVYFQLVDLLLQASKDGSHPEKAQELLVTARATVETLKAAELRDYFKDDCVDALQAKVRPLDAVAKTEAVVYPIILPDRLEILVTLPPPAGLQRFTVPVDAKTLVAEVRAFRELLERRTTRQFAPYSRKLYDWLIRPYETKLTDLGVDTLIFVPDGALRTIPMSALHDGQQFLIERFAVATTPGWNLTDPRPLDRQNLKLLATGLSESVQGFPALAYVLGEVQSVKDALGGDVLLNQDFRLEPLEKKLEETPFTIVHIASHGEFRNKVEDSFLLTYDGKLTMDRLGHDVGLSKYRDQPLELLTLSACETAAGDDRAALGLAGVAIKAGARSALGTLWQVNDAAAARLVIDFYTNLQDPETSRAKALQRAQTLMLADPRHEHPGYWSAFLLISSWL
ncbi:MAG TPA: CHAT domain-containing protein [Myxococcota bacterium]|nr:CHAT domain-containing protein [Myxococcota bacterium]